MLEVDYLIIGSGLAGLYAALDLAEHGQVLVITKRHITDSATAWAQGGIASVLPESLQSSDSFEAHSRDTLIAGAGLCNKEAVESIISAGPLAIERLVQHGVQFDKQADTFHLTKEAGHSTRRILHAQDLTGREMMRALQAKASEHSRIHFLTNHIAVDLITLRKLGLAAHDRCVGAYVLDTQSGNVKTIHAKATLLATGGAGKVYLYTSNPDVATGDGIAMAYRAGAGIANMEFFQFHPTCLYHPKAKSFLISEALRGEGGILKRQSGSAFMANIHPHADLAPRDIVARAIDQELKRSGEDYVLLDMTMFATQFIEQRFPNIHQACLALGIDMTSTPIPVVPAAHYSCGGVKTDLQGQTEIPGLWAAGEVAYTGLHGANRLASNSLLEAAVISARAARAMQNFSHTIEHEHRIPEWDSGNAADPDEMVVVSHNWDELRRTMWNYVGIVRSDRRLERARERIQLLQAEIRDYYWDFKLTHDLIELRNLCNVGHLIVESALHRRESRGLHYNISTPQLNPDFAKPTVVRLGSHDKLQWDA